MHAESNVTVMVSDMGKAVRFYTETLGLPLRMRWEDEYATVEAPGVLIGLHPAGQHGPRPGAQGALSIGLGVRDLDAAMAEPGKKGVRFHRVARDGPVRLAFFGDQDGNALYLAEVAGSEGAER